MLCARPPICYESLLSLRCSYTRMRYSEELCLRRQPLRSIRPWSHSDPCCSKAPLQTLLDVEYTSSSVEICIGSLPFSVSQRWPLATYSFFERYTKRGRFG